MAIDLEKRTHKSFKVTASSTNIPASFDFANAASLVLTGVAYAVHLTVVNETTTRIKVNHIHGDATSSPTQITFYVPAASSGSFVAAVNDGIQVSSTVFIASDSGSAISSGTVYGWVW